MNRSLRILALTSCALLAACGLNRNDPFHERPTVSLADAPPPIAGGTLEVSVDGGYAVVADPDLDRVLLVDLRTHEVREVALPTDSEPGRVAVDAAGRAYVALRRAGRVVEIDLERGSLTRSLEACASPRGLALDGATDRLHVACADGTLLTLDPDRAPERSLALAPDLRDVVVTDAGLVVSRFRSADLILVSATSTLSATALPDVTLTGVDEAGEPTELRQSYRPGVAPRMRSARGGAVVIHQRARVGREAVFRRASRPPSGYTYSNRPVTYEDVTWRDPCGNAVVHAAASFLGEDGAALHEAPSVPGGVVPVDVATSEGGRVALAFAGEPGGDFRYGPQVVETDAARASRAGGCLDVERDEAYPGQAVAVAYAGETLLVQLRAPAGLMIGDVHVPLGGPSTRDSGHEVFHLDTGGGIACASCHPEGGDDGHVWEFAAVRPVRTLPLEGAVAMAPYHRAGDVATLEDLMGSLAEQMAGPPLEPEVLAAVRAWLERLPAPPAGPTLEPAAVDEGARVFAAAGCDTCHVGPEGTDGQSHDVLGARWQTPPLRGLALRPPYLHDGSAATLEEALVGAETGEHGDLRGASDASRAALLAYLRSR